MKQTVFWSWQSDQDKRVTRELIKESLVRAIESIRSDAEVEDRISLDHDTRGLSGSPDIVASILEKIERSTVFVADITPIAVSISGKHIANPNVLIELGYAKRALGLPFIVTVWNTALTGCSIDDLPFDMRGRRGPISFSLPSGASKEVLRGVRDQLVKDLAIAIGACLETVKPQVAQQVTWQPARESDPSIWVPHQHTFQVNEDWGSGTKTLSEGPRWYARIVPTTFSGQPAGEYAPLIIQIRGGFGYSYGRTTGGVLTYLGSVRSDVVEPLSLGSMWFRNTGEVWSFVAPVGHEKDGRLHFYGDYAAELWMQFLSRMPAFLARKGGTFPMHIRLGVSGIANALWPIANTFGGRPPVAVEPGMEIEMVLTSAEPDAWRPAFAKAWSELRSVFGMPPPDPSEIDAQLSVAPRYQ